MIGMNIKQFRQEKHIKQETLADAIGDVIKSIHTHSSVSALFK